MSFSYTTVGFIGLGTMGHPMVENLVKKLPPKTEIYVFDVSEEAMERITTNNQSRVYSCHNAKEVAEKSVSTHPSWRRRFLELAMGPGLTPLQQIILTMVPEGAHVKAVYLTPDTGVLAADISSKLLIDCSTIDTATSLLVRDSIAEKFPSASYYDSPVSGGSLGAARATLTFMLGCAEDDVHYEVLRGLLGLLGTSIFPCGGPSLGLTAKLCNNYCSGLIAIATAEAMDIGIKSGMDPRVLASIFSTSTAQSCISDKWNPVPGISPDAPASHGYAGGFKVQLMKKDFGLAVEAAKTVGAKLALGEAGLKTYTDASNDTTCRDLDSRVVFRHLGGNEDWASDLEKKKRG
jgi:3-hydroxyisobutyrate dehydrogenase